jgi:arylsulfatase A-like enzyme
MATVAGIIDKPLPESAGPDSYNFWPAYTGESSTSIRDYTVHHSVNGSFAIRHGKWKLITCPGSGGWSYPTPATIKKEKLDLPPVQLFDMENDIAEKNNLIAQYPKKAKELTDALLKIIAEGRSTAGTPQQNDGVDNWSQFEGLKTLRNEAF